jgi:septal ring factor EnvC (AmiA/AmiB activator)
MNNARRKEIMKLETMIENLKDQLDEARELAEQIKEDEQEYIDNMPESLQGGEKYERAETAVSNLDDVVESLDIDIDHILDALSEARD